MTDDRDALRERLEAATGERIASLEAMEPEKEESGEAAWNADYGLVRENKAPELTVKEQAAIPHVEKGTPPKRIEHDLGL